MRRDGVRSAIRRECDSSVGVPNHECSRASKIWQAKAVDVSLGPDQLPHYRLITFESLGREIDEINFFISRANKRVTLRVWPNDGCARWHGAMITSRKNLKLG